MLQLSNPHATEFNEVIRRLKKSSIPSIKQGLEKVTNNDLQKVQELVNNPKSIFKENLSFFKDENTPHVFLQAFKLDEISVSKFAMLVNLYNSIQISEPIDCLPLYDEQSSKLVMNVASWEKINTTLTCFYNYNYSYVESTHIKCTNPIIDYDDFIQKLQHQLASASPLERFIFLFKKRHITTKETTIHGKLIYIASKERLENAMLRTPLSYIYHQ